LIDHELTENQFQRIKSLFTVILAIWFREYKFSFGKLKELFLSGILGKSQFGQDLFVISKVKHNNRKYFVELGASDGIELSNTYLLETWHGWSGLLIEPAEIVASALVTNRPNAFISLAAVVPNYEDSYRFIALSNPGLSHLINDDSREGRDCVEGNPSTKVKMFTLTGLLAHHNLPNYIDFLSLDVEGLEFEILKSFDFSRYCFGIICVEHNYRSDRLDIHNLLSCKGYKRVYGRVSKVDDWYIKV
jgi:FkbM family methyltransferase